MAIKMQDQKMPSSPGIYFFKKGRKILYVGKAANLRARLRSYKDAVSSKTSALLKESTKLDWQVLNSETEALIKESELIKKYQPKYNVLMRDDKQYFFVAFTRSTSSGQAEKYSKIYLTHQTPKGPEYIGPFSDGGAIKFVLRFLRRIFPYCTCKKTHKNLCLNARIGRCLEFCCIKNKNLVDEISRCGRAGANYNKFLDRERRGLRKFKTQDFYLYKNNINSIKKILSGKNKSLLKSLGKEMKKFSQKQKYEEAGKIRNQIRALEKIFAHKEILSRDIVSENIKAISSLESLLKIKNINRIEAYDIANIQGKYAYGSMVVFIDGVPAKDLYRIFKIKTVFGLNDVAMIKEVISRRFQHTEWPFPDVILVDGGKGQLSAGEEAMGVALLPKVIALTKNKKHVGDHIFISGQKSPLSLDSLPPPLKNLLLHLDSEAHRFAIKHYRQSHRKMLS